MDMPPPSSFPSGYSNSARPAPASAGTQRPAPTHSYGNANSKRVIVTSGQGGPRPPKPVRPNSAAPQAPRTLTTIDNASEYTPPGGGTMTKWRPQTAWRPAGGLDNTRLPYSQPWFRQGQGALDQVIKELREMRSLVDTRTTERDHALHMAQEANEMWANIKAENAKMMQDRREADENAIAERAAAEAAQHDAQATRDLCDRLEREKGELQQEVARARELTKEAQAETAAAKMALERMAQRNAEEMAVARKAAAELAAANELANRMEAERAAEKAASDKMEEAKAIAEQENQRMAAAEEEAKRLRAIRAVIVPEDTRDMIEKQVSRPGGRGGTSAQLSEAAATRYTDPEEIFNLLDGGVSGQGSRVTLIRASWLRAKQPRFLPSTKADLPPEALIYASELRKIYRQTKNKEKFLPIISVLHPLSSPMSSDRHPDQDGAILAKVIEALDMRWDQFTRKRGTGGDSGIADLGVFFDWCALEEPTLGKARTPTAVEDFGLWYSHQLVTVWMMPEGHDPDSGRLTFTNGWSAAEYLMATTFKATTDLSGFLGPWPQLLDLSEELDFEHNERINRPPPAEPLVLIKEHELGDTVFHDESERKVASDIYQKGLFEQMGGADSLTFQKLAWGDVELARLSLVLPLCCNLTLLNLSCNAIGDKGIVAFAEALSSLEKLETLLMSSNEIGDPGASRFAGAITDGALAESLKKLDLGNNHIGDKGALTLASAISGGAIYQCKSVNLKGNPMSPAGKKAVAKAAKGNKGPPK